MSHLTALNAIEPSIGHELAAVSNGGSVPLPQKAPDIERLLKWKREHPERCRTRRHRKQTDKAKEAQSKRFKKWATSKESDIEFRAKRGWESKRAKCRKSGIQFDLTYGWYLEQLNRGCAVTGLPFRFGSLSPFSPSVDRIDQTKGYTEDNCRMVLFAVNSLRGSGSDADMYLIAEKIFLGKRSQK